MTDVMIGSKTSKQSFARTVGITSADDKNKITNYQSALLNGKKTRICYY